MVVTHWGNIRLILGLYRDNGKENGSYYLEDLRGDSMRVAVRMMVPFGYPKTLNFKVPHSTEKPKKGQCFDNQPCRKN